MPRMPPFRRAQAIALDVEVPENLKNMAVAAPKHAMDAAPSANHLSVGVTDCPDGPLNSCIVVRANALVRTAQQLVRFGGTKCK